LVNTATKAINKLEEIIYYQKSCTIEDYLEEFQILILKANYTDPYTVVAKFCHRLQIVIQNQIMILLVEKPKDSNLHACFEAIYKID